MLSAGDADTISVERSQLSQLRGLPGIDIIDDLPTITMSPVVFFTFHINPVGNPHIGFGKLDGEGIPPDFFSDVDVRKGFAYALDYEAFIRDVNQGKGTQATGSIPKTLPGHDPDAPHYNHDLKRAERAFQTGLGRPGLGKRVSLHSHLQRGKHNPADLVPDSKGQCGKTESEIQD